MNVLVLGGTVFLGRHVVAALIARGHAVTLFNRGTHDVDAQAPVTRITGDRRQAADVQRIPPADWDAAIDLITAAPGVVAASAQHLHAAGRYVYVSSVSVYRDLAQHGIDETAAVFAPDAGPFDDEAEAYGWQKARSEEAVRAAFGAERATLIRPGLIVGPYDPTDRFTAWPRRVAAGGTALVPGPPQRAVQFIDARDVADFIVHAIEARVGGTYNVTSPRGAISMEQVVEACRAGLADAARPCYVEPEFLAQRDLSGWVDLPLWISPRIPYGGLMEVDVSRALAAGLTFRPLEQTVRDTRSWMRDAAPPLTRAGLSPERETELLEAWNAVI
ncbi:MAG: SDR family oxidoreductase [Candidatus Velthaea sp.]